MGTSSSRSRRATRGGIRALVAALLIASPIALTEVTASATPPAPTDVGTLGGSFSEVKGHSENGVVAGNSTLTGDSTSHAFAWTAGGGIVDLGDLDDEASVPTSSDVRAVGSAGHVVGVSGTADFVTHAFLWNGGSMIDLGDLGDEDDPRTSVATAVNASGQVTGQSGILECICLFHAFLWDGTDMNDLGTLGGRSWGVAINDSGQVAGDSEPPGADEFHKHAFFSGGGSMVDIGTLGGSFSRTVDLSNNGEVVGVSGTTGDAANHAFYWSATEGIVDIGTLGGNTSQPVAINDNGHVIGWSTLAGEATSHAFLWTLADGIVDLGTLGGGSNSFPMAINESGQVVGWSATSGCCVHQPFSWTADDGMVEVGNLGGSGGSAIDVNESGQVVGNSPIASGTMHAFAWSATGGTVDLGTLSGAHTTVADRPSVNDDGQVIGNSVAASGQNHGVVWQLGDEPTATTVSVSSSANPALVGEPVTYTATVDPIPDGGTVAFEDDGTTITGCGSQSVDANGEATCEVAGGYGTSGTHPITAEYSGTTSYAGSTSTALDQEIEDPPATATSTLVTSTPNPAIVNEPVTYTATVSPAPNGGTVAFNDGATTITGCGAKAVDSAGQATCAVSGYGAAGTHAITAMYSGNPSYATSTSPSHAQVVAYGIRLTYDPAQSSKGGGPTTVSFQLVDVNQVNLSSSSIVVTVTGVTPSPTPGKVPSGTFAFRKGGYSLNVQTGKWPAGTYSLQLTAGSDPTPHSVPVIVR